MVNIFDKAHHLIVLNGLARGQAVDHIGRICTGEALTRAGFLTGASRDETRAAWVWFRGWLCDRYPMLSYGYDIPHWNDYVAASDGEVLTRLREASADWDAKLARDAEKLARDAEKRRQYMASTLAHLEGEMSSFLAQLDKAKDALTAMSASSPSPSYTMFSPVKFPSALLLAPTPAALLSGNSEGAPLRAELEPAPA